MGTTYRVKYWGDGAATEDQVHEAIELLLAEFDLEMSTYRDDSELSRFNRAAAGRWFNVSPRTAYVVSEGLRYAEMTGGALDVTVAPVLRLWHFGSGSTEQGKAVRPPGDDAIAAAVKLVGRDHVRVRTEPPALWKDADGVEVDLSALAPGYAVDLMVGLLQAKGFANSMVECGGEVRAVGARPDGTAWRIGVERARGAGPRGLLRVVELQGLALTTAGDYNNFRVEGGERYTHIIDPRSGRALPYRGASVTVVAETCLEADALDTALMVMGPEEGMRWCHETHVAAMFQYRGQQGAAVVKASRRFVELVGE
jgi:thiamine biosynthesis lipoprotein